MVFFSHRVMFSALLLLAGQLISTSLQAQTAEFVGNVGAQWGGNTAILTADQVNYTCPSGTTGNSGTLQLELWATTSPYSGGNISGYSTAYYQLGQLNCNTYFYDISSGTVNYTAPPSNATYYTMLLMEFSDGAFYIVDYVTLSGGATTYALTVSKSGSGSGTVTSSNVSGINCGSTCSASYSSGTSVTLSASPASGSTFGGWSGSCSGTGTCTVSMTQARSVTASFNATTSNYALTVSKAGSGSGTVTSSNVSGINCGSTCSASYSSGTSVTLSASPASGSTFGGWSGSCSGTGTCTVSMTQARSVTASFQASVSTNLAVAYSGLWKNPAQTGHGFSISVVSATHVIVYWYTYDPFGNPIWILGDGEIIGNTIIAKAWYFQGMVFGTWDPADREDLEWGTFEIEFDSCDSGTFTYASTLVYGSGEAFGSGMFPITRIAYIDGVKCQ